MLCASMWGAICTASCIPLSPPFSAIIVFTCNISVYFTSSFFSCWIVASRSSACPLRSSSGSWASSIADICGREGDQEGRPLVSSLVLLANSLHTFWAPSKREKYV